jgi:hypothetical protein
MADTQNDTADEVEVEDGPSVDTSPRATVRDTDPQSVETGGLSDAELIARRSADIHEREAKSNEHVKVFVLPPGPKPTEANGYDHAANKAATRQYALSGGLRPVGELDDVRLVSIKQHDNGVSWLLTYAVEVVPVERGLEPSGPDFVTSGEDVSTNTTGTGHSSDTSDPKPPA